MGVLPDLINEYNVKSDFTKNWKRHCIRGVPADGQAYQDRNRADQLKALFRKLLTTPSDYRADAKQQTLDAIRENGLSRAAVRIMLKSNICNSDQDYIKIIDTVTRTRRKSDSGVILVESIPDLINKLPPEKQDKVKERAIQILNYKINNFEIDECEAVNALYTACVKTLALITSAQ